MTALTVFAPASIGNVSLGFDVLGAAIKPLDGNPLGDSVSVQAADSFALQVNGRFADKLPGDPKDNIVTHCYQHFNRALTERGIQVQTLALSLHKALPIGSGLGSSAASIVAAFAALNDYYQQPFSQSALLLMMGELEGQISGSIHYDNVAPAYLGGMTLMTGLDAQPVRSLPVIDSWYWVVCYSGISVSTAKARAILPKQIALPKTLDFGRQLAVFVDALHRQDQFLAASVMQDVIAEPYRKSLLPGFDQARAYALEHGALAFGISGSGPTVFAVCNDLQQAEHINSWLAQHYVQNEQGFSHVCKLDNQGTATI